MYLIFDNFLISVGYGMVAINNYVEEFGTKGKKAKHKVSCQSVYMIAWQNKLR